MDLAEADPGTAAASAAESSTGRRLVGGSLDYMAAANRPLGPQSFIELGSWPSDYLKWVVQSRRRRARFLSTIQNRLVLHTQYSGKGSVEMCYKLLGIAMKEHNLPVPEPWFHSWSR